MLYAFGSRPDGERPSAPLTKLNGALYGTTVYGGSAKNGTVFRVNTEGVEKVLHSFRGGNSDGAGSGGLLEVNGALYGTTAGGGDSGPCDCGVVFRISAIGTEKVLYHFRGGSDGAHPAAGLVEVDGTFYGTTLSGGDGCGSVGCRTVYSISPTGRIPPPI